MRPSAPRLPNVRSLWRERNNKRAAPLLLVVLHDDKATVCGPAGLKGASSIVRL